MAANKKIEIIQILRLIGAISIIVYHSGILGEYGYFAVEIFCILSGYVLMYSTQKEDAKKGFLRKRLLRIVPVYWLCTLLMYLLLLIAPQFSIMGEAKLEYLLKSMFFIPFVNGKGYGVPIVGVGWTLNYEVFFYIIFFIAMKINHKLRGVIASIMIVALVLLHYILPIENYIWNYYTESFILEFVFGIVAFYVIRRVEKIEKSKLLKGSLEIVSVICFIWMMLDIGVETNVVRCVRIGIPAFLFFVSMIILYMEKIYPKWLVLLGNATFSIYLLEYFSTAVYKVLAAVLPLGLNIVLFILMLVGTLVAGYGVYRYFESPIYKKLLKVFL